MKRDQRPGMFRAAPGDGGDPPRTAPYELTMCWSVPGTSGKSTQGRDRNGALIGRHGTIQVPVWDPLGESSELGNRLGGGDV